MMNWYRIVSCAVVFLMMQGSNWAAAPRTWDFEKDTAGWRAPGGNSGIVAEPGNSTNHVFEISATKPHHTLLTLAGSEATPDFVASARFKILAVEGEAPTIYLYGRHSSGGFCALTIRREGASLLYYYGQGTPGKTFAGPKLAGQKILTTWVHAKFACCQCRLLGKVWIEGAPEPGWQMEGEAEGLERGAFALGVWTSPRTPSKARVLFDDVTFQPISAVEFAALQAQKSSGTARPALDAAKLVVQNGVFENATEIGLATPRMVVAFDKRSGSLSHILQRESGQDFVAADKTLPLFNIALTKLAGHDVGAIDADEFRSVSITHPGPGRLELNFRDHATQPLTAQVRATTDADGFIRMRLGVHNPADQAVARIEFPRFAAPAVLGKDANDDRLLLPPPLTDGAMIEAPGTRSQQREALYPEGACTQFAALYDATAGLYLAALDADGHCKRLGVNSVAGKFVELPLMHLLPEVAGRDVALPYDIVLGVFTGDWRDAADLYKRWAKGQPWCAKKITERADIPQFLKEGAGVIIAGIQNQQGYNGLLGANLEKLPQLLRDYRERTSLTHMVLVPYGWENRGTWAGINYLPAVPSSEAWVQAAAELRKQNDRTAMLTSGFWWVIKRKATSNGPAFDDTADFERRKTMVVQQADGAPFFADAYDKTDAHMAWRGLSAKLCHGSAAARTTLLKIFLDVARLGTPLISFDQEIGGGQREPCYNPNHGHPPGYGNWMWTGFRDLCEEILRQGKPLQPELGLLMENCCEVTIPVMATYWSRQFGEVDHGAAGARGVGLFSYLYHEYVTAIGAACVQGQGPLGTRGSAELRCHALANNLARGLIPGPFMQDVPLDPGRDAWKKQVMQAYFAFCQPYAHFPEYLLLGETRRPPILACATQDVWFWRQDAQGQAQKPGGPKLVKATVQLPCVIAGSFAAADGSVGTVLINTTPQPQQSMVTPPHGKALVLYRADRTEEQRWASAPATLDLALEPLGVRLLVAR